MSIAEESLKKHYEWKGKIEVIAKAPCGTSEELSLAYTPGVAQPCLEIQKDPDKSYELTRRWNLCAVITDGTAILGLGDIGPEAGMPVMEGKCALFKSFGDVDAFPLCIKTKDADEFVRTVYLLSGSFGGVNLEDIAAPRCFEIERKLKEICDIPIFHDDQHGTAIIVLSGLINALKVVGKTKEEVKVVVNGAGSAGIAVSKLLLAYGFKNLVLCDRCGIMSSAYEGLNWAQKEMLAVTNLKDEKGTLADALIACANPTPEIFPEDAIAGGAKIISTGRSDYPNQINNVLVFPGVFRGVFDVRAKDINEEMKMAAAMALASVIPESELNENNIIPKAFDPIVKDTVAKAVAEAARRSGVARI